jgi:carbon monoxide dehydrogenase subunit G
MRVSERISIAASTETVWTILSDWERQASWMPDVAWIRVVGTNRALGGQIQVRTKVLGVPLTTDVITVTAWEPPYRLAVEHRGVVAGTGEWILRPRAGDSVEFTWQEEIRMAPPILGDLALWLYGPVQRWMVRRSLRNLARLAAQPASA